MKFFQAFLFIVLSAFLFSGCSESIDPGSQAALEKDELVVKDALIYWQGAYEVDGCGFFIEIDSKMYKAKNEEIINNKYKKGQPSDVQLKFKFLNEPINSLCGDLPYPLQTDGIEIVEICDIIKNSILGEWEWVESAGGIAGVTLIPETVGYTQTYNFWSDSNLSIYRNDTLISETKYHLNNDTLRIDGQDIYPLVVFKTNRIILYDQCVDCFTNTYERKGIEPELIRISAIWYSLNLKSDPVEIYDVNLTADIMNLDIGYSGCVGHDFELFAPSFFMESNPLQTQIGLYHKSSYDMCPVYSHATISFDLTPLREQYQDYYGEHGSVLLNISVLGDTLKYARKPLYEF
jgi:hypothetical protein